MKHKESELIVKAIVASMATKHSVADLDSRKQLRTFGINSNQIKKLKKNLSQALSGTGKPDSREFQAALKINTTSTIRDVATQLPKAYKQALRAGGAPEAPLRFKKQIKTDADIIIRTSLGQNSPKYSLLQISPHMELKSLGLNAEGIAKAKGAIFRTISGANPPIKRVQYVNDPRVRKASTVEHLVDASIAALSFPVQRLSGDDTTKPRGFQAKPRFAYSGQSHRGRFKEKTSFGYFRRSRVFEGERVASLSGDDTTKARG